jgi:hypothetical protein
MTSLYNIFHNNLEDLLSKLSNKDVENIKSYNDYSIIDKRKIRVLISLRYYNEKFLIENDKIIVDDPYFFRIMLNYEYEIGIKIIKEYKNNSKLAALYIKEMMLYKYDIENYPDDEFDNFLKKLETIHNRIWVIDCLLSIKLENDNYIYHFSVLKYIGNDKDFKNKFISWFNNYNKFNFDNNYKTINVYLEMIALFLPYIPNFVNIYIQIKNLNIEKSNINIINKIILNSLLT